MKFALLALLCLAMAAGAFMTLRQPHPSAYMRGQKMAQESGCVGCHEPKHAAATTSNPGSLRGVIPTFHSGLAVSGFWVQDSQDFREWVINGSSRRTRDEAKKLSSTEHAGVIRMPAYGTQLSDGQIADLYTYYTRSNAFHEPVGNDAAAAGLEIARAQGCFACHGDYGLSGIDNPGSFKGYIPSWEGEDFEALARNDGEIREWIRTGSLARIRNNPVGNYFMSRQKIQMPAYQKKISEDDINHLVAYIHAVPTLDKTPSVEAKEVATAPDRAARGKFLFQNAGCVTCHRPEGVEGFTDRHGEEIPSEAHIAYRLKESADLLLERQNQTQEPGALCHWYRGFADEYHQTETLILNGAEATPATPPAGEYIDTQHLTPMPAWGQRANPEFSPNGREDRDSLIDYLLGRSDASVRPETIDQWLMAAATCTEKPDTSHPKVDDETRQQQLLDRIKFFDQQEKLFDRLPVVTFFSEELSLVDQVGYFRDKEVDYWLLRQATNLPNTAEVLAKGQFTNRMKFVIAVDKTDIQQYKSYFFTTRDTSNPPEYVSEHFLVAPVVGCFGCHVSGPRLVRPGVVSGIPALVDRDWNLIKQFNHDIRSYGDVATPWPTDQKPLPADWMEPVTMPVCQTCHQEGGLRAPLRRYHTQTLSNLIDTYEQDSGYFVKRTAGQSAVMPPVLPLSISGRLDLLDWTRLSERKRIRPRNQPHPSSP